MIRELQWDSQLLQKKIGRLTIDSAHMYSLQHHLERAQNRGFDYLTCKIKSHETLLIRALESSGFYLTDVGIVFSMSPEKILLQDSTKNKTKRYFITAATHEDIPMLKKLAKGLFLEGRFYHDPFFSGREADRLYQTWIENSVRGNIADVVFMIEHTGFVTCKKINKKSGAIILVGIRRGRRGQGFGRALIQAAMGWFLGQGIHTVSVRTQIRNIGSIQFYQSFGCLIEDVDFVFGKIFS
jgi:GNAT superfamily N-acetyltransferase